MTTLQVAVIGIDGSGKSTLAASLAVLLAGECGLVAGSAVADEFWVRAPDTDLCGPCFQALGAPSTIAGRSTTRRRLKTSTTRFSIFSTGRDWGPRRVSACRISIRPMCSRLWPG